MMQRKHKKTNGKIIGNLATQEKNTMAIDILYPDNVRSKR